MKLLAKISAFLPLAVTLIWLQLLPDRVPVHYDFAGTIDRWGSKWEYLLLPGIVLVMGLIFLLTAKLGLRATADDDQKRAHAEATVKVLRIVMLATALMFTVLQAVLLYGAGRAAENGAAQSELPLNRVVALCLGVLLIVLGNFMPKAKMNSAVGLRCGWTAYNDVTWQKGNRFGGWALMAAGFISIPAVLLAPDGWAMPILLGAILGATVASLIYAKKVYDQENKM